MQNSPNKQTGRKNYKPEAIVLHITEGGFAGAVSWLCNPKSMVSAHFVTSRSGVIIQLVDVKDTAWHAGLVKNASWSKIKQGVNPNLYTIGIENEGTVGVPPTGEQIWALARLIRHLSRTYGIPLDSDHIIYHRELRSDKSCPGPYFDKNHIIWLASFDNTDTITG